MQEKYQPENAEAYRSEQEPSVSYDGIFGGFDEQIELTNRAREDTHLPAPSGFVRQKLYGKDRLVPEAIPGEPIENSGYTVRERRARDAHWDQEKAGRALKGSIFDLPQDRFGLPDQSREERVIIDFNPQEYRREEI